ncbi:MAG: protein kinase [Sandaracinaceae bacterium]|nr:protein kinase [Sandaracinaceae bacterium]
MERSVGKYRLLRRLGGDGAVERYLAEHRQLGRQVELHCLAPDQAADSDASEQLVREARVFGAATHRNVQGVVDSGRDDEGRPYVVFEAMRGQTLESLIAENPRGVGATRAARLVVQILEALRALHDAGVVLRTLTPAEITLENVTGDEELAKLHRVRGAALLIEGGAAPVTTHHGSIAHLAPELRRGDVGADPRVDFFSVGVILRQLLTGRARGDDEALPDTARRAIARACADDPDERFAAAEGFLQAAVLLLPNTEVHESEQVPTPQDPLSADLQYLHLRRITRHGPGDSITGDSRMSLLPVLLTIEAVYRRYGEGVWAELCNRVQNANSLLPGAGNTPVHLEKGVPVPLFAEILRAIDEIAGDGDMGLVARLGEAVSQRGLKRLCPDLPEPLRPAVIVDGFRYIWSRISRHGEAGSRRLGPGSARLWVASQPTPSLELAGWTAGLLRDGMRQTGATEVEVLLIGAEALGDGRDMFGVDWRE